MGFSTQGCSSNEIGIVYIAYYSYQSQGEGFKVRVHGGMQVYNFLNSSFLVQYDKMQQTMIKFLLWTILRNKQADDTIASMMVPKIFTVILCISNNFNR